LAIGQNDLEHFYFADALGAANLFASFSYPQAVLINSRLAAPTCRRDA
jgi:hypothetical protein